LRLKVIYGKSLFSLTKGVTQYAVCADTTCCLQKIQSRQAVVTVIGLGYVGLPLALAFAKAGFRVIGIDVNPARLKRLSGVNLM